MDWKKLGKKLLFPPVWLMFLLTAVSAVGLVLVFTKDWMESPVAYIVYVLSFYTLSVVCIYCAMVLPGQQRRIKEKIYENPLGNRYMTDRVFRTKVSLYCSLGVNLLYAAVNVASWFQYRSWWFVCLAVYYATLSVMRFVLVRYVRLNKIGDNKMGELKRSIFCSSVLLTLNFFLSGAVLMIVYQDKGYEYPGILIYVVAMYTFYTTTHAIIEIIRYRKLGSPVMSTAKAVSLASALVSMLNLETAMFASFGGEMSRENQRLMIMLTGAGVSLIIITMSVYHIVRSVKEIRKLRSVSNGK